MDFLSNAALSVVLGILSGTLGFLLRYWLVERVAATRQHQRRRGPGAVAP
jgi:hypothetical protein